MVPNDRVAGRGRRERVWTVVLHSRQLLLLFLSPTHVRWPRGPADEETVSCRACGEPARHLRVRGVMSGDKGSRLRNVDCQGTLRAWLESQTLNWQLCQCQSAQGCETCYCGEAPPHGVARLVVAGHMVGPFQEVLIKCLQAPCSVLGQRRWLGHWPCFQKVPA